MMMLMANLQVGILYIYRSARRGWFTWLAMHLKIMQFTILLSFLQIIFYIDALRFHYHEFNLIVHRDFEQLNTKGRREHERLILNKIKCYKIVHFRLWEASQRINKFFGWVIIGLVLYAFVDTVYSAFWLFEEFRDGEFVTIYSNLIM